jgi:hypothetical protein
VAGGPSPFCACRRKAAALDRNDFDPLRARGFDLSGPAVRASALNFHIVP